MQSNAISIYKTVGSLGFLLGAGLAPLMLAWFDYFGTFLIFFLAYTMIGIICALKYPQVQQPKEEKATTSVNNSIEENLLTNQ